MTDAAIEFHSAPLKEKFRLSILHTKPSFLRANLLNIQSLLDFLRNNQAIRSEPFIRVDKFYVPYSASRDHSLIFEDRRIDLSTSWFTGMMAGVEEMQVTTYFKIFYQPPLIAQHDLFDSNRMIDYTEEATALTSFNGSQISTEQFGELTELFMTRMEEADARNAKVYATTIQTQLDAAFV